MIENQMTLVEFLNEYSFDDDAHYESSTQQRQDFRDKFPLENWPAFTPEDYAIDKKRDTICYRLQFSTKKMGSMNLGSQKNALIYRERKSGKMYYPPEYESLDKAWDAIRDGFVRLFDSAQSGDWADASKNEVIERTRGVRIKLLSVYFPDDVLAIYSKKHLTEFLKIFEVPSTEYSYGQDIITLNRKFLGVLRSRGFNQSPIRLSHGIYLWRDTKKSTKVRQRFWIEKALKKTDRALHEEIGRVLISPSASSTGADIYANMREVQPGDVVLHLVDSESITGLSVVADDCEVLADNKGMRVELRDFKALDPVLLKEMFLNAQTLEEFQGKGLFFNKHFEFNQGGYLTEAPLEMVKKFDDLYFKKTGRHFPNFLETAPPPLPAIIFQTKNIILHGPPGTGKTYSTKDRAVELANRGAVEPKFKELLNAGRVRVVTFHQSLGYEEFVEGLRPTENEDGVVQFGVEAGLFAEISLDAAAEGVQVGDQKITFTQNDVEKRELTRVERRSLAVELMDGSASDDAYFDFSAVKQYVLVIDEINRGNISKILGELITLLEPSKRLTAEDEMIVRLPYSKQAFGVPPNLHVIGTMNTADRSIALLDVALRRRFVFEEMMPDVEVLRKQLEKESTDRNFVEITLNVFIKINDRIRFLYDRDHQIGHAYFFEATDWEKLRCVFVDRVIPLLEEYFYGDWLRVCAVLGCPFDESYRRNSNPIIATDVAKQREVLGYDMDGMDDQIDFKINPDFLESNELETFFRSIL